jgi:hypothetical protein
MNINFGLMPPLTGPKVKKGDRKRLYTDRARQALGQWIGAVPSSSEAIAVALDDRAVALGDERG